MRMPCQNLTICDIVFQITIHKRDPSQQEPRSPSVRSMQYKVTDKNVNFFALGMSAAVLWFDLWKR